MKINKKMRINDNICKADCFEMQLSDFVNNGRFFLTNVDRRYKYDENHKRTNVVESIVYTVTDERLNRFQIRVPSTVPVIEQDKLDESEEIPFVELPINETVVKPYKMEFGKVYVSISAPWIRLVPNDAEFEEKGSDELEL